MIKTSIVFSTSGTWAKISSIQGTSLRASSRDSKSRLFHLWVVYQKWEIHWALLPVPPRSLRWMARTICMRPWLKTALINLDSRHWSSLPLELNSGYDRQEEAEDPPPADTSCQGLTLSPLPRVYLPAKCSQMPCLVTAITSGLEPDKGPDNTGRPL